MLHVTILCVGKLKERFYAEAVAEYAKRLSTYCRLQIIELPEEKLPENPSRATIDTALEREAKAVRAKLPAGAFTVALCVEGKPYSSQDLADLLCAVSNDASAKHLVFLVGSSYGLAPALKAEANVRLSMSPMTFPHHLFRVMLTEQIYRAFTILEGGRYHK